MFIYWSMYVAPLLGAFAPKRIDKFSRIAVMLAIGLVLVFIIGLRHEVGCDWYAYQMHYERMQYESLLTAPDKTDVGYATLNWFSYQLGLGVYGVNTFCAAVLIWGLLSFSGKQPLPWLTFALAMPILVISTGMALTRQATAIGFLMLALNAFTDKRMARFLIFVTLATMFHKTAICMAPLAVFLRRGNAFTPALIGVVITAFLGVFFVAESLDRYTMIYVERTDESSDVVYRVSVNLAAAAAFFFFRKRWLATYEDGRLYLILAVLAVVAAPFMFQYPVAVDRTSLYLLPFQTAVFARLPMFLEGTPYRVPYIIGIVGAYGALLYVWLAFASHAFCWVPYQNLLT